MKKLTQKERRDLIDELVNRLKPDRIILFDSHALGEAAQGRDVDKES